MIASLSGAGVFVSIPAGALFPLIVGALLAVGLYMLPTIIGSARKVVNIGSVFAINLLLGWTLIGWVVALALALRTNPPYAYGQYWRPQETEPPPAPPGPPPGWYADPSNRSSERWWDGFQWTNVARPTQRRELPS
jgi:hypothetical protein